MMRDAIQNFPAQFAFKPVVENGDTLGAYEHFVVLGMGGSHLGADMILAWHPEISLAIHSDYGIPHISQSMRPHTLVIGSSYSGNTEETIDGFEEAGRQGIARAAVSVGGRLRDLARKSRTPFVQFPDTGIQPRSALGMSMKALLMFMGKHALLEEFDPLVTSLARRMSDGDSRGKELASQLRGCIPVVYASGRNSALAENWKIKFNETAKIPAFWNVLPELNHNEMTGFDAIESTRSLSEKFFFIFLEDPADHTKVQKRMVITEELYRGRGMKTARVPLSGKTWLEKVFSSVLLADWTAYHTSEIYDTESEQVPMVEEFKKRIA